MTSVLTIYNYAHTALHFRRGHGGDWRLFQLGARYTRRFGGYSRVTGFC